MSGGDPPWIRDGLFARLRGAAGEDWRRYTQHDFVRQLARGTLPEASFRRYLGQDYLFLIHFARAYALAIYKSASLAEMREAHDHRDHLKFGARLSEHCDLSFRGRITQLSVRRGCHRSRDRLNAAKRGEAFANKIRQRRKI